MQTSEHTVPVTRDTTECDCCTVQIGNREIPRLVTLPDGTELAVCHGCAQSIKNGDFSTVPEVSQL